MARRVEEAGMHLVLCVWQALPRGDVGYLMRSSGQRKISRENEDLECSLGACALGDMYTRGTEQ